MPRRPARRPPLIATLLTAVWLSLLLAGCSGGLAGGDLVEPFGEAAERAYAGQDEDRSDEMTSLQGVRTEDCFVVSDDGLREVVEAVTGEEVGGRLAATGFLSGPPSQEQLGCSITVGDERVEVGLNAGTLRSDADGVAESLTRNADSPRVDVDPPSGLDADDVVVADRGDDFSASWVDDGFVVGVTGPALTDADTAVEVLGVAVEAVTESLGG